MKEVGWSYPELVNRNWGFISACDQDKIKSARVLLAGCGLGSNIAVIAARTGFTRFIMADGDVVEVNNLNRQAFRISQLGRNKAEATAQLVTDVNPEAEIEVIQRFITEKDVPILTTKSDLIVNMVDPGPVLFAFNQMARSQNKPVFFPLNVGFGGVTLVFTQNSATIEEMVGKDATQSDLFLRMMESVSGHIPYFGDYMEKFAEAKNEIILGDKPAPQLGVAASINASLVVTAMVRALLGFTLRVAPEPLTLDAWNVSGGTIPSSKRGGHP